MLEARHLRIVRAISDTGSLTKAAVELGLTQPALTHQLHRMERLFGGTLFVRDRRGARPTPLGLHVIERARVVLPSMDALVREARILAEGQDTSAPQIRVAIHPSPLPVAVVAALREAMPYSQVSLRNESSGQRQLELLATGALEVAILTEYPNLPMPRPAEIVVHEVVTEPLFVALSARHVLAGRDEISLADLATESWIIPEDAEARTAEHLRQICDHAGIVPNIAYRVTSQVARDLISRGLAITLFQPTAAPTDGVAFRPLKGCPAELRHVIAVRAASPVARFGAELAEAARISYWNHAARSAVYREWLFRHPPVADRRPVTR
ncbi:MAG TPA: LysR family transcriptional regulator [Actinophytocola sp.]|uniref:LysR substrate-binding domain-containing protein n=1 Tax=Actinophytocola sp. TaxID=1872138 RepID=UPI002DB5CA64|nr:LysR family transcriptional regulator [Actinophytocola sp.]HEU5471753.1 LysR family transcriptional regulator [Actinophytocola sp.]